MYRRVVPCDMPGCRDRAAYKIAAPWSDGNFVELKTYGLACAVHLRPIFRQAERRRKTYTPRPDETVAAVGVYRYECGKPDRQLQRLWGLEKYWGRDKNWGLVVTSR